jgi:hypothetical protein
MHAKEAEAQQKRSSKHEIVAPYQIAPAVRPHEMGAHGCTTNDRSMRVLTNWVVTCQGIFHSRATTQQILLELAPC